MSSNHLGDYLRARRDLVTPEDVGLPGGGRRRVPGLRREELALLAGISTDYYLRLEQGRDRNPSPPVLDALARVLRLDSDATRHLHALAAPAPRHQPQSSSDQDKLVPPGIQQLIMTSWARTPALVLNRYMDVLAANRLAVALSPAGQVGTNAIRAAFLDPRLRDLYVNWDEMAQRAVAGLRALIGPHGGDPRVVDLANGLSVKSESFRRLWARHDVSSRGTGLSEMNHPMVGRLELRHERLLLIGTDGQLLVVHHADPGTPSARKLSRLADMAGVT
ncbi:helix-turn-helix transcriptional regulator [Streptomyces sp. NBC_00111]|uniref:helix-turn-helix domain-containing protein n=1 Tax=unclassified Streptomyces TaxID=2593676 RepID=UPI002E32ADBA|nr:helix-turn-helix transcriptional regulator [Streptomyces sp. NBC_01460]